MSIWAKDSSAHTQIKKKKLSHIHINLTIIWACVHIIISPSASMSFLASMSLC
jgi:hypothetical protein